MYFQDNMFDILHSEEFATIQIIKGSKRPANKKWNRSMITDIDLSVHDVAVDCFRSDIVIVDIDCKTIKFNNKDLIGKMLIETPNGYHIYFKVDYRYNCFTGSERSSKTIDMHGKNRYCICPPTNGYNLLFGSVSDLVEYSMVDIYDFIENNLKQC